MVNNGTTQLFCQTKPKALNRCLEFTKKNSDYCVDKDLIYSFTVLLMQLLNKPSTLPHNTHSQLLVRQTWTQIKTNTQVYVASIRSYYSRADKVE